MPRFRVFAGPNGSGKSTIIKSVKNELIDGHDIDFGCYANADEIAVMLARNEFSFRDYGLKNITNEFFRALLLYLAW